MGIWVFINQKLQTQLNIILLVVVKSEGSSPGREGFKMAVCADGSFCGTIGGGIMEQKLVEKAKSLFTQTFNTPFLQEQFHSKNHKKNQSGMICSGSQIIAFVPLFLNDKQLVTSILQNQFSTLTISQNGLALNDEYRSFFNFETNSNWQYSSIINNQSRIHIIGGGHCGLALSIQMKLLNFMIHLYDDRSDLNTIEQNIYAQQTHVINYENIGNYINLLPRDFVVIMTIGYRTDKLVLKQLLHKKAAYIGLLGSKEKIKQLFLELENEGENKKELSKVFAPIGLNIQSKTASEIAVSIAAEIIKIKNSINN